MAARATAAFRVNAAGVAALLAKVGQATYDGVSQAADMIRDEAKAICPVATGWLQASITAEVSRGIQNITGAANAPLASSTFGVTGIVAPHTDYAAYVEFGTGRRGQESPGAGPGPYKESWPGMAAQPYMRNTFDERKDDAIEIITGALQDALG